MHDLIEHLAKPETFLENILRLQIRRSSCKGVGDFPAELQQPEKDRGNKRFFDASCDGQRSKLLGFRVARWTQAVAVLDGRSEPFYERTCVVAETLLARDQGVAVVAILHVTHFWII